MAQTIEVSPAYGRNYTNRAGVRKDWNLGCDFRMPREFGGGLINKLKAQEQSLTILLRYDGDRKLCTAED